MALVPSTASSRWNAELRLAQAVSQFEADLTSDQKAVFNKQRLYRRTNPPDSSDVMRLTAEIDRQAAQKGRGVRCFGPRLTNVLQAVKQFASIGDVLVGGSQNIVACGVWTAVRMSLLLMANFSSHLETVSLLFMAVGRSAPRYQTLALIYPHSKNLASYLSEYFILIVQLCHRLLKFTQKSFLGQLAASLSDPEMKTFQTELEIWASNIREEVNLLLNQKVDDESSKNSRFRALSTKFSETQAQRQKLKHRLRVLNACSAHDHESTWKQTRKIGSTSLFSRHEEYDSWKASPRSSTLIWAGKLGSGKSVLMANIVDDLNLATENLKITVAYFFCRHDLAQSLEARNIIGSLARQVLDKHQTPSAHEETLQEGDLPAVMTIVEMVEMLSRCDFKGTRPMFLLDGLDECTQRERSLVCSTLGQLQNAFSLLVCISVRLDAGNSLDKDIRQLFNRSTLTMPRQHLEMVDFINATLEDCLTSERLNIGDPAIIVDIRKTLLEEADGMFLWVALQIDSLCERHTDQEIRQALLDLPKGLPATFQRILNAASPHSRPLQTKILRLISISRRPLTIEELKEALSIDPGNPKWNPENVINNMRSAMASCGSLLVVDEEELTVRLVHHSVCQFLHNDCKIEGEQLTAPKANAEMTAIIVTYLTFSTFERQLAKVSSPNIQAAPIPSNIIRSVTNHSTRTRDLALRLLGSSKKTDVDASKVLVKGNATLKSREEVHHFFSYAKESLLYHVISTDQHEEWAYKMLVEVFETRQITTEITDLRGRSPLSYFAEHGHEEMVAQLLKKGADPFQADKEDGRTPLIWASVTGQWEIINQLMEVLVGPASRQHHAGVSTEAMINTDNDYLTAIDTIYGQPAKEWAFSRGYGDIYSNLFRKHLGRGSDSQLPPRDSLSNIYIKVATMETFHHHGSRGIMDSRSLLQDGPSRPLEISCNHEMTLDDLILEITSVHRNAVTYPHAKTEVWILGDHLTWLPPRKLSDDRQKIYDICRQHVRPFHLCFWVGTPRIVDLKEIGVDRLPAESVFVFLKDHNLGNGIVMGIGVFYIPICVTIAELAAYTIKSQGWSDDWDHISVSKVSHNVSSEDSVLTPELGAAAK
ncbi:Putative NACHT nucleoside triphosphatase, P-loop containing nucleoside triphosphate hydrolase [Colletotrichum destructivum]|uniref:NACHT nucleoside triphosphatase, P-loop containing nucleoside triphosphate hydrolase n=1 Tax=Colletotrichum destructivum TaxID=34406 RepID=A0AAX4J2R1_9PEZI|nr:Putative NACHT nucleoside triphosphatase, P-loop containing nucleoside triphosphate hydrolase [Colletotrichum destructivum]